MDAEGWVGLQAGSNETSGAHKPLSTNSLRKKKRGLQSDKICIVYTFCHKWFLSLWAICWTMSLSWRIAWCLPGGVMKTLVLFGGMNDSGMACAFVQGLPNWVKRLFHTLTQTDNLSINQLLADVRAITKDEVMEEESMVVAVVRTTWDETRKFQCGPTSCHCCNSPNHFAKDCKGPCTGRWKPRIRYYTCNMVGHISCNCLGNEPAYSLSSI